MALAIPADALPLRRAAALEPPLEIMIVRFTKPPVICFSPQYVCEELLRAEGFAEIRYVDIPGKFGQARPQPHRFRLQLIAASHQVSTAYGRGPQVRASRVRCVSNPFSFGRNRRFA
jgi:hypothetical protein